MSKFSPFGGATYNLSGSISSTATSITLVSFLEPVTSTPYTMVLINSDIAYGTIAPKTTSSEFISFTGITQNADGTATLTGVTRGLAKKSPFTSDVTYKLPHSGQTQFIISDAPQVFNKYVTLEDAETISGAKSITGVFTFDTSTGRPALSSDVDTAVATELVDFGQLSRQAIAGAANASTTVKGLVELATQAETDAGTTTGGTGALLVPTPNVTRARNWNNYAIDSVGSDAYAIAPSPAITAYADGQVFMFKAGTANTGNATLAVNGLTAKNILKSISQTLQTGDILAGQRVIVSYDAANDCFQLLSVPGTYTNVAGSTVYSGFGIARFGGDGSDGALTVASGTTTINLGSAAVVVKNYTSISITGTGAVAFSNPHANGTTIIFRSQGAVALTSSATRLIDLRNLGSTGGTGGTGSDNANGTIGTQSFGIFDAGHGGLGSATGVGGAQLVSFNYAGSTSNIQATRSPLVVAGPGGGGGQAGSNGAGTRGDGGAGGRGAGALYIECATTYNATGTLDASGTVGGNGTAPGGAGAGGTGGGGGAGGMILVIYNTLTADSATYTVTAGSGGNPGSNLDVNLNGGGGAGTTVAAGTTGQTSVAGGHGGASAAGVAVRMLNNIFA